MEFQITILIYCFIFPFNVFVSHHFPSHVCEVCQQIAWCFVVFLKYFCQTCTVVFQSVLFHDTKSENSYPEDRVCHHSINIPNFRRQHQHVRRHFYRTRVDGNDAHCANLFLLPAAGDTGESVCHHGRGIPDYSHQHSGWVRR